VHQRLGRRAAVVAALAGLRLALPGAAAATGVSPAPKRISAASAPITACGSLSAVRVSWTVTANVVTTVVLSSIPAACASGSLSLTLVDVANATLATAGPVTVTGSTQTISALTGSATSASVAGAYISVVGP
jgi:hypothetical protein